MNVFLAVSSLFLIMLIFSLLFNLNNRLADIETAVAELEEKLIGRSESESK